MRKSAFTLIELSVSMTAGSALMILAIGMIHQSMTLASTARERSDRQRTLNRLAQEFRQDVHRATKCIVASPDSVRLVMADDSEVVYTASDNRVTRQQQLHDGRARHEAFEYNADTTSTFEHLNEPDRAVLTVVSEPHPSGDRTRVDRKVAAAVGRLISLENAELSL